MKTNIFIIIFLCLISNSIAQKNHDQPSTLVKTANGLLEGVYVSGIREYKGVPYAQAPVGNLRWKEPQPVKNWEGKRMADHFSPRAIQLPLYSDMNFRSDGMSEDCLYLNIWTSAKSDTDSLPVLVYFYGGGFKAGDGSEFRYDGESMSRRGIISVTVNYRLGVFGFFAHPELSKESPHHASGNYGFMDQAEALRWVHKNIAAFGGDPDKITIAGESAGATAVFAQIISPLPRNLFSAAIGESISMTLFNPPASLKEAEKKGLEFSNKFGAQSLAALRAMPATRLLDSTSRSENFGLSAVIDGYFFPESPLVLYATGRIAKVPLLVGWNSEERDWKNILGKQEPTKENYVQAVKKLYPAAADDFLKIYSAQKEEDVKTSASALGNDRYVFNSWNWGEKHAKTNNPVYRYVFTQPRPGLRAIINLPPPSAESSNTPSKIPDDKKGAVHSGEIEYALGNLPTNLVYDWQPEDYRVSSIMQSYFLNFIKTKNPNGTGLPPWPLYQNWQKDPVQFIGSDTYRAAEPDRAGFLLIEKNGGEEYSIQ